MTNTSHVMAALQREFCAPRIDQGWVDECAAALVDDGQAASLENIREQLLYSDLSTSTLPSNLIPEAAHDVVLFPKPTLLQIITLTEVGSSAFQLQTTLEQRREHLSGATRIRRMDDEGEDSEEEDRSKMPNYPRSMLKLELTDGSRVLKAMEYRRLEDLKLGETCLGAKLKEQILVHRVRALRGTLLLCPDNTTVLGYEVAALEADQPAQFVASLLQRMGKLPQEDGLTPIDDAPHAPPVQPRQPALPTNNRLTLPPRQAPTPTNRNAAARSRPDRVESPYFGNSTTSTSRKRPHDDMAPRAESSAAARRRAAMVKADSSIDDGDDDFDDSFIRQVEEAEATAVRPAQIGRGTIERGTAEYVEIDDDEEDDAWFAEVDVDELQREGRISNAQPEVIEISD